MWHLVTAQQWKETFCLTENEARISRQIQREYNRGLYNSIVMLCVCKSAASVLFLSFFFLSFFCSWLSSLTHVCSPEFPTGFASHRFLFFFASLSPQPREQTCKERRKEQNEWNFPNIRWNPFHFQPIRRGSEPAWSRSLYRCISLLPGSNPQPLSSSCPWALLLSPVSYCRDVIVSWGPEKYVAASPIPP